LKITGIVNGEIILAVECDAKRLNDMTDRVLLRWKDRNLIFPFPGYRDLEVSDYVKDILLVILLSTKISLFPPTLLSITKQVKDVQQI
jgi:hypothetical protein